MHVHDANCLRMVQKILFVYDDINSSEFSGKCARSYCRTKVSGIRLNSLGVQSIMTHMLMNRVSSLPFQIVHIEILSHQRRTLKKAVHAQKYVLYDALAFFLHLTCTILCFVLVLGKTKTKLFFCFAIVF